MGDDFPGGAGDYGGTFPSRAQILREIGGDRQYKFTPSRRKAGCREDRRGPCAAAPARRA